MPPLDWDDPWWDWDWSLYQGAALPDDWNGEALGLLTLYYELLLLLLIGLLAIARW